MARSAPFVVLMAVAACGGPPPPPVVRVPSAPGAATRVPVPEPDYWPTTAWRDSTPESQGMSSPLLADALLSLRAADVPIHAVVVVRRAVVVLDASFHPFSAGARHDVASITKSVTSMLAGAAVDAGRLSFSTRLPEAIPAASGPGDTRRDRITLASLLAMESGLDCGFGRGERELVAMKESPVWIDFAATLPMRSEPGTEFGYCSPNYHLVSGMLERETGSPEDDFARTVLFGPLGITDVDWPRDPQGTTHGWGDLQLRPRDLAKLGFLYLHGGRWGRDGRRIVPTDWVARSTAPRARYGNSDLYGYGWWTETGAPPGFFEARGRGGQRLTVWPEKDLVVVILGGGFEPGILGSRLIAALVADTALPADPEGVERLRDAVARVARPPEAATISRSDLEKAVSGRTYAVEANGLGLERLALVFGEDAEARVTLELRDRTLTLPVGLDGRYRIAEQTVDGIHPGTRGSWTAPSRFVLELDLIGKIDHYTLDMTFAGSEVTIDLVERTGLMRETVRGTVEGSGRR